MKKPLPEEAAFGGWLGGRARSAPAGADALDGELADLSLEVIGDAF